jgi:predicted  nucleic acid-binding Zn-ribbon protein
VESEIQGGCRPADETGMLLCKACNTRFGDGKSACPSCGRRVFSSVKESSSGTTGEVAKLAPVPEAETTETDLDEGSKTDVDLELGLVDVLAEAVEPEAVDELKVDPPMIQKARRSLEIEPGPAVLHLSAAQVRTLVAEQPGLLQSDLAIYRDASNGVVGVDLRTPVGAIDLLARDAEGNFVVVMVPDPRDTENLMPEMLGRIGWVRKHLASKSKHVRGIVVIEEIPEELAYAAAGVGGTITFHAFRVALTFHRLEL